MSWTHSDHMARLGSEGPFDVLVIGGGIVGAGTALDLAARGLSVALVEQTDFAAGTSSRSTKLLHGGIRYLPHYQFQLVAEGLREQKVLAEIADYLFRPLEFVIPLYRDRGIADAPRWASRGRRARWGLGAGLTLYDLLGGRGRPGDRHRMIGAKDLAELLPSLRPEGLTAGFVYSDAATDDARLVLAVLKTAVSMGAVAVNRTKAIAIKPGANHTTVVMNGEQQGEFPVTARAVVIAAGAFPVPQMDDATAVKTVLSKGTHLLVDRGEVGIDERAVVLPETDDDRVLFVVPWQGYGLIGTTDTPYQSDPARPVATADDVAYLLDHLGRYLKVGQIEVLSTFAGLRALADTGAPTTAEASREEVVAHLRPGMVQVAGGKLTTYRRIAARVGGRIAADLRAKSKSTTSQIPLVGAGGDGTDPTSGRYGTESITINRLVEEEPALAQILTDGRTLAAEGVYAVRHEAATRVSDVMLRRTHLARMSRDHGRADAPVVAALIGRQLGWSPTETNRQIGLFEEELVNEGL
jgi:glycerol-3-phosphate dehydrogenase